LAFPPFLAFYNLAPFLSETQPKLVPFSLSLNGAATEKCPFLFLSRVQPSRVSFVPSPQQFFFLIASGKRATAVSLSLSQRKGIKLLVGELDRYI